MIPVPATAKSKFGPHSGPLRPKKALGTHKACRTWEDLAARLVWARQEGYCTAKVHRANGYVDRPLLPSEQERLVEAATRLVLA
jgi:hypothetical protein